MRKISCLALAVLMVVMSSCAFAQGTDKYYEVSFSNPSIKIASGEDAKEITLTGLKASYSRGKVQDDMAHVFDVSANETSAARVIILQNAERLLACVDGMNKAFSFPIGANEKTSVEKIDMSALLKFTEAFNFVDEGKDTQEFMYGATLSANKTSLKLDNAQLDGMIDSLSAAFGFVNFDTQSLKDIDKNVDVDIWTTDDGKYLKIEAALEAAKDDRKVSVPVTLQGKVNENGTVDIVSTVSDSNVVTSFNAHISPDEEHPLHPSMNVTLSVSDENGEALSANFVTGCNHLEDSTTRAMSFTFDSMGETVFKALGSKKETSEEETYTFKAGLNDELSVYCATKPYQDETSKGDAGYVDIDVNLEGFSACVKADVKQCTQFSKLEIGDVQNLEVVEARNCTEADFNSAKTDLWIIAIRAIGVLTDIPEVNELITSALAA